MENTNTLTVAIRGFCLVSDKGKEYDVLLNPKMGHGATLTILTRFLNPPDEAAGRWDPDRLGYVPVFRQDDTVKLEQVGIWDLTKEMITLGSTQAEEWPDRKKTTIAFGHDDLHKSDVKVSSAIPRDFTIVTIKEGKPAAADENTFTVKNSTGEKQIKGTFEIRFADVPAKIANSAGKSITFEEGASDIFVVIANLAKEPNTTEAFKHFDHYYDALVTAAGGEIQDKFSLISAHDEVYDCVPPGTVP
jgi:hypothetical protein